MPFIDFEALKKAVSFEAAINRLGLDVKQSGNQWRGMCPACGSDDDRMLVITEGKGFYCFSLKKGGDVIALTAHIRDCSVKEAAQFLAPLAGISTARTSTSTSSQEPRQEAHKPPAAEAPKPRQGFDRAKYQAGLSREVPDVPKDICERADIGISTRGALKGVVLPLYDKDTGEFICYAQVTGLTLPKATVVKLKTA